jgi:hypothetical protein
MVRREDHAVALDARTLNAVNWEHNKTYMYGLGRQTAILPSLLVIYFNAKVNSVG